MSFDPKNWRVCYINLDSRPDRREQAEAEFAKVGLSPERFMGLGAGDAHLFPEFKLPYASPGELGCAFAHLSIVKDHIERGDKRILAIFEDDIVFCDDFLKRLEYLQKLFFKWDMFYLSAFVDVPGTYYDHDQAATNVPHLHRVFGAYTCHSYLLNSETLVDMYEMLKIRSSAESAIDRMWPCIQPYVLAYCFIPGMVGQRRGISNITGQIRDVILTQGKGPVSHMYSPTMEQFDYESWCKTLPAFSGQLVVRNLKL
jgi:GR25 family glycosyltransferase involved in LPS biosynthesis